MRAVLARPDAVPERASLRLDTASVITGPVLRPRPTPTTVSASSIGRSRIPGTANTKPTSPSPMKLMPAIIMARRPTRAASGPDALDTAKNVTESGSSSAPAANTLSPRASCR